MRCAGLPPLLFLCCPGTDDRVPCKGRSPAACKPMQERCAHLLVLLRQAGIQGVVLFNGCDACPC